MGASAVVTLIKKHEFAMLGVQALPDAFREAGIEWHHLPVKDVHAPDQRFETWWVHAGARLRERLRDGERVLVALPADAVTRVDVLEPLLELFAEWEKLRSGSRP